MNHFPIVYVAVSCYKILVKPITIVFAVQWIYIGGSINSLDDILNKRKKPIYENLFQMAKYATTGALIGVTFPISIPITIINGFYQQSQKNNS